ncbi:MAG: hypothetical protein CMJ19_04970 [Phycisphaeraceae bacterium]|nr:hypothetical protein [Phycisphaeraceae bacterium]
MPQPSIAESSVTRLICECKAHNAPIGINDWLKFLGKLFTEKTTSTEPVSGLLVALSGINGNVAGHYDAIKKHRTDIQIVTGDKLVAVINKFYNLRSVSNIIREIQESTHKSLTEIDLAYYSKEFFYVITFTDNCYTLIPSNPNIADDLKDKFNQLISLDKNLGTYINLAKEREAQTRHQYLKKAIITALLMSNGKGNIIQLLNLWNKISNDQLDAMDITTAIDELTANGIIYRCNNSIITLSAITDRSGKCRAAMFRELTTGTILLASLGLPYYDTFIDESLLEFISELHGIMPFPKEEQQIFISILRWSPTALFASVTPRQKSKTLSDNPRSFSEPKLDRFKFSVFRQELIDRFIADYHQPQLAEYFHRTRGIREIETSRSLTLKSPEGKLFEFDLQDRIGIGEADESLGGGFIHIRLVDHAPQPWETWNKESNQDGTKTNTN